MDNGVILGLKNFEYSEIIQKRHFAKYRYKVQGANFSGKKYINLIDDDIVTNFDHIGNNFSTFWPRESFIFRSVNLFVGFIFFISSDR